MAHASSRSSYRPFQVSAPQHLDPCVGCTSTHSTRELLTAASLSATPIVSDPSSSSQFSSLEALSCHTPPADQLTAQCTDQCVVIACNNPDHPESLCPRGTGPHPSAQCDFVCDEAVDCADCHGFDAFLQCCDDYHPYSSETTPPASTSSAWEVAFAEWCAACAPASTARDPEKALDAPSGAGGAAAQAHSSPRNGNLMPSHLHHQPMSSYSSVDETFSQRSASTPTLSRTATGPPSPGQAYSCMWAACSATFISLSELVGHVNLDHLALSSSSTNNSSSSSTPSLGSGIGTPTGSSGSGYRTDSVGSGMSQHMSAISCLWDNCGSSYYSSGDNSFELLANHLLNEHLGADPGVVLQQHHQQLHSQHPQQHQHQHPHHHDQHAEHQQHQHQHHPQQSQRQVHHHQHQHPQHERQPHHHHHHAQQEQQQHLLSNNDTTNNDYERKMHEQLQQLAAESKQPSPFIFPTQPSSSTTANLTSTPLSPLAPAPQITATTNQGCPAGTASHTHECRWKACGALFSSCDALTAHISDVHIGAGKARYQCFWEDCGRNGEMGFVSKQKISRHVQSHTGHRPFQCSICHQNFSEAATLQQHTRRHTQEKPYVCDHPGCGKSFAITGALTIHKRTHNGDKPFKCSYCDRGFAESSNLSKHLRTHTGARPYICTEPGCNKAFARPDQLNRHKGVHKKQARGIGGGGRATIEA